MIWKIYCHLAREERYDWWFIGLLLVVESFLSVAIVQHVAYAEIDWIAYMQEVSTWWDKGEYDYRNIRGDTGPLVYPAGFLYLFQGLRYLTQEQVPPAQYVFIAFYVATQAVVLFIYQHNIKQLRQTHSITAENPSSYSSIHLIWLWRLGMACLCASKRLHSIFLLRLFNDGPTMLLLYFSMWMFMNRRWNMGCVVFSLAVSVKMNVLLFAPGLLLLLLQEGPSLMTVFWRLALGCALPQLILGAPFLWRFPVSYLRKAFELDRVFFFEWTVNWKMIDEELFVSKPWALFLLVGHLGTLVFMTMCWCRKTHRQTMGHVLWLGPARRLSPPYICHTMLSSNFVGIVFARTLHYQFYVSTTTEYQYVHTILSILHLAQQILARFCAIQCWYFHAVPFLLLTSISVSFPPKTFLQMVGIALLGLMLPITALETAFLTFPATPWSSSVLQFVHWWTLLQMRPLNPVLYDNEQDKSKKKDW